MADNLTYFWLESGEDGTHIREMTKAEVHDELKELAENGIIPEFLRAVPEADGACWMDVGERAVLLIKGQIIVPHAKLVVKEMEVP